MMTKENDWFLAQSENPSFSISNFMESGLTPENTQLREKSFYENNRYIQSIYQKDGKFDKATFDIMYDRAAKQYQTFSNNSFKDQLLSDYQYDPYNSTRPVSAQIKEPDIQIKKVPNPLKQVYGFGGIGSISEPTITVAEAAQKSKIFDWETQKFLDYSPNDVSLENSFIKWLGSLTNPLVLATYEEGEESIDPVTGMKIKHKKGEYKVNEDGDYYYETLGGRSPYGKQVKSVFDTLTVDGSKLNKYDFFDSDGLDKSVTGTIAKTAAVIAPLFTPIAPYYGYAMVGSQLMDLLPTLYNSIAGNFTDSTIPLLNQMQGLGRSLQGSTSQYSKENLFTFENFANTIADVALQWQQQRAVSEAFRKLSGTDKLVENAKNQAAQAGLLHAASKGDLENVKKSTQAAYEAIFNGKLKPLLDAKNRSAANAALGYMAGLQAFDTYEDVLEQGATKTEAALMAWGTALGMYKVDRTGLGELFFPELESDAKIHRAAINTLRKELLSAYRTTDKTTKKGLFKLMDKARDISGNYWQNVKDHSLGFAGKVLGEGIEEVSEELVTDFTKSTFNMLTDLGLTTSGKKMDAWENAGDRYLMNFFGGAVGGGVFYGVDLVQNRRTNKDVKQELVYLIRNGKKQELLNEIEEQRRKGKLGSSVLSASKFESAEDGSLNYLSADNQQDSQNEKIAKQLKDIVEIIDRGIFQEDLDYSDAEIIDKLLMADERMQSIISAVGTTGTTSRILKNFNDVTQQIVDKITEIKNYEASAKDKITGENRSRNKAEEGEKETYDEVLSKLKQELEQLKKRRDEILGEDASKEYVDKLLFEINEDVNKPFFVANVDQFIEAATGKTRDELTVKQIEDLNKEFIKFKEESSDAFDMAYKIYKYYNKKYTQTVNDSANSYEEFAKLRKILWEELIDFDQTALKFDIAQTDADSIDYIQQLFANNPDADPVLKLEYDPRDYSMNPLELLSKEEYQEFKALSEEDQQIRLDELRQSARENYEKLMSEKAKKIKEIIKKFKDLGFIDSMSRRLLLKAIGTLNINPQELVEYNDKITIVATDIANLNMLFPEKNSFAKEALWEQESWDEENAIEKVGNFGGVQLRKIQIDGLDFSRKVSKLLSQLNGDNLEEITSKLENLLKGLEQPVLAEDPEGDVNLGEILREQNNNQNPYEILENSKRQILEMAKEIDKSIKESELGQARNELLSDLKTVKQNPLYTFLQKIATETSGKKSNVLEILEDINSELNKAGLLNFQLNKIQLEEIDKALNALQIVKSLVVAASSEKLSLENRLFGHNAVYNEFVSKFGDKDLYGVVNADLSYMMLEDLALIEQQLKYLQKIAMLNGANRLEEQRKTGESLNRALYSVLKPQGEYQSLRDIEIEGIKLFDGIDIETPELEQLLRGESPENLGQLEIDMLQNKVYSNFQKIVKESGLSIQEVYSKLIEQLLKADSFKIKELLSQRTTSINSQMKNLTAYDSIIMLLAVCSLSKQQFNEEYQKVLSESPNKIVPVYPQEYSIFIATAMASNPVLFNTFIKALPNGDPELLENDHLAKIYNSVMIDGVGGAGKTTILAIIKQLQLKFVKKKEVWAVAPKTEQLVNLDKVVKTEKQYVIDQLFEQILSSEDYAEYIKFKQNPTTNSSLFEYDKEHRTFKLKKDLTFKNIENLGILIVDEHTYIDVCSALILSQLGLKNGTIIDYSGDNFQNGYSKESSDASDSVSVENLNRFTALAIRCPKLEISMRSVSIQKQYNERTLTVLSQLVDIKQKDVNSKELNQAINTFLDLSPLTYYEGDNEGDNPPLSGEKLVDTLSESDIIKLLGTGKKVIYVYDASSKIKSIIDKLSSESKYKDQIIKLEPQNVQGLEAPYTIVDVDFTKYKPDDFGTLLDGIKHLYTMLTRSEIGTFIINNGITNFLPHLSFQQMEYFIKTPDIADKISELTEKRIQLLKQSIELGKTKEPEEPLKKKKKPLRTGNTAEDVKEFGTILLNDIIESELPEINKKEFIDRITEAIDNVSEDTDWNEVMDKLTVIRSEFETLVENNKSILEKIKQWKQRLEILKLLSGNVEFVKFLTGRKPHIQSQEDFKADLDSIESVIQTSEANIEEIPDEIKDKICSYESDVSEFESQDEDTDIEDNIIDDDDTPPQEPDPDPIPFDGEILNSIRIWGFYNRQGNENEDLRMFLGDENKDSQLGKTIKELYLQIQSLFTYHTLDEIPELLSKLVSSKKYEEVFKNEALRNKIQILYEALNAKSGKFKVVISRRTIYDDMELPRGDFESDYVSRLVYEYSDGKRITIGALTNPDNWISKAKSEDITRATAYAQFIKGKESLISEDNPEVSFEIEIDNLSKFTNLEATEKYSFAEFKEKNPHTIFSRIYASGIDFDRLKNGNIVSGSTRGYPVVFCTNDPFVIRNGGVVQITSDNIADLYIDLRTGKAEGAVIRKVVLDPKGQWLTSTTRRKDRKDPDVVEHGLLNTFGKFEVNDPSKLVEFLKTRSSNTTGIRILTTMWNWRAYIRQILEDSKELVPGKQYVTDNIILLPQVSETEGSHDLNTEVIVSDNGKRLVFKNRRMLEAWESMLNDLIDASCRILGFAANMLNLDENKPLTNNGSKVITTLVKSSSSAGTIEFDGVKVGFTDGQKIIGLLQKIYSYTINLTDDDVKVIDDFELTKVIEGNGLKTCAGKIVADFVNRAPLNVESEETNLGTVPIQMLTDMFNLIFHGKKYPYSNEEQKTLKHCPFPNGVYFHPHISHGTGRPKGDPYYELSEFNTDDQFDVNVVIQNPNLTIKIKMDTVKTGIKIPEPDLNKDEILQHVFDELSITDPDMQTQIEELWDESEAVRQQNINETLEEYSHSTPEEIDALNALFADARDPNKQVLFTFRGKLGLFIKTHTFMLMSALKGDFPTKFTIDTTDKQFKISIISRLKDEIGNSIYVHPSGGYIYYEQNGNQMQIDTNTKRWGDLQHKKNKTTGEFTISTKQLMNTEKDFTEIQTITTRIKNIIKEQTEEEISDAELQNILNRKREWLKDQEKEQKFDGEKISTLRELLNKLYNLRRSCSIK